MGDGGGGATGDVGGGATGEAAAGAKTLTGVVVAPAVGVTASGLTASLLSSSLSFGSAIARYPTALAFAIALVKPAIALLMFVSCCIEVAIKF